MGQWRNQEKNIVQRRGKGLLHACIEWCVRAADARSVIGIWFQSKPALHGCLSFQCVGGGIDMDSPSQLLKERETQENWALELGGKKRKEI